MTGDSPPALHHGEAGEQLLGVPAFPPGPVDHSTMSWFPLREGPKCRGVPPHAERALKPDGRLADADRPQQAVGSVGGGSHRGDGLPEVMGASPPQPRPGDGRDGDAGGGAVGRLDAAGLLGGAGRLKPAGRLKRFLTSPSAPGRHWSQDGTPPLVAAGFPALQNGMGVFEGGETLRCRPHRKKPPVPRVGVARCEGAGVPGAQQLGEGAAGRPRHPAAVNRHGSEGGGNPPRRHTPQVQAHDLIGLHPTQCCLRER